MTLTRRLAAVALLLVAGAAVAFGFGGARPAAAEGTKSSGDYVVIDVPDHLIDDLVAAQRGTSRSGGGWADLVLDLSDKFCGTYQCLCIDLDPDECYPDADQVGDDRISLVAWLRTPAVVDMVLREKLCGTFEWLVVGCEVVAPARG